MCVWRGTTTPQPTTSSDPFPLALNAGGTVSGAVATTLSNTGTVTLGNDAADVLAFEAGLIATAPTTRNLAGTISALDAAAVINLGGANAINVTANTTLGGAATGAITLVLADEKEMETRIAAEQLEAYRADLGTQPRVHYKNLYRWTKVFVAGSVAYADTDECADGAKVTVTQNGVPAGEALGGEESADLSITKSVSSSPLIAGQNGTYTIVSTNRGPGTATDVSITEYVVAGTEVQSVTCSGASISYLADRVVCTWAGATSVGASRTMVLTGRVCPELACGSSLRNTAETALNPQYGYDPNPSNNRIELSTPVEAQSSLSISMSDSPDPVIAGNNLTYNLVVRNSGPSNAQNVVVRQTLPAYTQFVSASSSPSGVTCSANGDQVTCNVGVLGAPRQCTSPRPEQYSITIVARVSDLAPSSVSPCTAPPLSSTAAIASGNCRPDTGTLSAAASTRVLAGADIVVDPAVVAGLDECIGPGAYLRVQHTFSNSGPRAYTAQRDNAGPEFSQMLPAAVVGVNGSCTVVAGGGTCEIGSGQVGWNGTIAVGETVTIEYRVRVRGATMLGTEMCFGGEAHYDECNTGANTALATPEEDVCVEADCPSLITPNRQLGMQVHLPILNYLGNDDLCETWIEVQAIGAAPMKAVLVTWGEPGFCPPQAAGPLKVECTGLLMPGTTWNLLADQIPSGSKGGMLFKFSAKQLSDVGLDDAFGFDDVLADLMCETLFFGVVGDADDYRRFKKAYNEGSSFGGIPQEIAAGWKEGGILAVDVLRDCPSPQAAGVRVTSKYNGIAGSHLGQYDPVYGGYSYYVPLIYAKRTTGTGGEYNTWVYIQNGGLECSSVEIWLKKQDDCLRAQICELSTLAPGETFQFDPSTCVGPGWLGSLWIRTTQPMGIAVDIWGNDILMTYVGEPAELNYTFDPGQADASPGNQVAFGPLVYSEYQGWDTGIQVQNLSPVLNAKVKVYFLDRSGDVITTLVDWICPRGSQTFFLPVVHDLPGNWVGSVRVESQEWITPGGPLVEPPNIVGVATLIKYGDAQRADTREAIAYNLLPEHKIFDWQLGFGGGDLDSGIGLIAIPSLLNDLDGTGVTSELAIANIVPKPGFTDFAIYIYDQNGLMDYVCQKLNEKQVEYIDLQSWGYVNEGFKGSAIISAVFWEHDVFDGTGQFLRNLVGLGAVAVERSKTRLGEDIAGDEAAGARGIPFKQSDVEDEEFEFTFLGPFAPLCPGVPSNLRPKPGEGPAWLCPPSEVQAVFGTCSTDPGIKDCGQETISGRYYRGGVPTECGAPDACSTPYAGTFGVDWYTFDNPNGTETCVEVKLTSTCANYQPYMTAHEGRFDAAAPCGGFLGQAGSSGTGTRMGFIVPAGVEEWTIAFSEVYPPAGACAYSFTIEGFACQ